MSSRQPGFKCLCVQQSSLLMCPWARHLIPAAPWVLLPPWPWSLTSLERVTDKKRGNFSTVINNLSHFYYTCTLPTNIYWSACHSEPAPTGQSEEVRGGSGVCLRHLHSHGSQRYKDSLTTKKISLYISWKVWCVVWRFVSFNSLLKKLLYLVVHL